MNAFSRCVAVGATLLVSSLSTPAVAGNQPIVVPAPSRDEIVVRHVSYADLNLAAAAGERTLVGRVRYAVNDLCSEVVGGSPRSFMLRPAEARCSGASWDQARPQIDLAVRRAREIALTGKSSIVAAALIIAVPADR